MTKWGLSSTIKAPVDDILALLDSLQGTQPLPIERTDIDRSDEASPSDLMRLIDLLNGAGGGEVWYGKELSVEGCP